MSTRPSAPARRPHLPATALLPLLWAACSGCSRPDDGAAQPAPPAPAATDRLLVLDGMEFTFGDVQPFVAYLDLIYPNHSEASKIRRVLDEFVVPRALARREFGDRRRQQFEHARDLCAVAGNVVELEQHARLLTTVNKVVGRRDVELPVSMFLFDPARTGARSEPIELPHGWTVVGCRKLDESAIVGDDRADALQVPFLTHAPSDFTQWYDACKKQLADKATFVAPGRREAMPLWLKTP